MALQQDMRQGEGSDGEVSPTDRRVSIRAETRLSVPDLSVGSASEPGQYPRAHTSQGKHRKVAK